MKPAQLRNALTYLHHRDDDDVPMRPLDIGLIRRMYHYTEPHARTRTWLLLLVFIRSIQLPALTWTICAVIKGPIDSGDSQGLILGAGFFLLLAVFTQWIMHYRQKLALEFGEAVVQDLRNDLFRHLQRMPMSFFHRTKVGRIISRMTSDVENVRIGVQEVLFVSLVQIGQMIVAALFMLWYDPKLFTIVLLMAPVLWLINRHFHHKLSRSLRAVQESFSRVTATLAESVNGIRVTQGFVRQDANARMFSDLVTDHSRYNMDVSRAQGMFLPLLDLNSQVLIALLLMVGGYIAFHPTDLTQPATHAVGNLVGFFFMAGMFFAPISVLGNQYNQALTAMAGAERVFRLLDLKPDWTDPPDALDLTALTGRVELRNLSFAYEPQRNVLKNLNFTALPGQTVALVGHTGSGKTSFINLVAKFYLPTEGELLLDGIDIHNISSPSLHQHIGIVLQQNFLFSGTVLENIRLARPQADDNAVRNAARQLGCLELLEELPQGLLTQVGERGSHLSVGQRQLVCFVRAMLANPRILILDEATSNIDAITEAHVQQCLAKLLTGRTSFVIAHRLSTIRHADVVLLLDEGKIVEQGTHDELIAANGQYARLYEQFVSACAA